MLWGTVRDAGGVLRGLEEPKEGYRAKTRLWGTRKDLGGVTLGTVRHNKRKQRDMGCTRNTKR